MLRVAGAGALMRHGDPIRRHRSVERGACAAPDDERPHSAVLTGRGSLLVSVIFLRGRSRVNVSSLVRNPRRHDYRSALIREEPRGSRRRAISRKDSGRQDSNLRPRGPKTLPEAHRKARKTRSPVEFTSLTLVVQTTTNNNENTQLMAVFSPTESRSGRTVSAPAVDVPGHSRGRSLAVLDGELPAPPVTPNYELTGDLGHCPTALPAVPPPACRFGS